MLSILIPTRNRPYKLIDCIKSMQLSSFRNYEILIVDQNKNPSDFIQSFLKTQTRVSYYHNKENCKSKAINFLLQNIKSSIVVFTDDDCYVDSNWLSEINQSFKNKALMAMYGRVLPYKTIQNQEKFCPCIIKYNKQRIIDKPCYHADYIGFGNNMAFRREIFNHIGGFKEWLGPGSIGSNAEDAEFSLRALIKGYKLLYNPKAVVYHNKWLEDEELRNQCLSYSCGEVACYGYFGFQGLSLGKEVVKDNFYNSFIKLKQVTKSLIFFRKGALKILSNTLEELLFRLRGLLVGWYYSKRDPL